jgi:hypothetical protein
VRSVLDPAQFQNSAVAEGTGGVPVDLGAQIAASAVAPIEQQRRLTEAALSGNPEARAQLLSRPETLPEVKAVVTATSSDDPAALARARSAIDAAEQEVRAEATKIGPTVTAAVKTAYTTSITRIYLFAIPLSVVALLVVVLWLPEIPLSRGRPFEQANGE